METEKISREDGFTVLHTPMSVKGHDVVVSSTTSTLECGYLEVAVFGMGSDGEPDFSEEYAMERYSYRRLYPAVPTAEDEEELSRRHDGVVAGLTLLEKGVVFGPDNDIADIVWACVHDDFSMLK